MGCAHSVMACNDHVLQLQPMKLVIRPGAGGVLVAHDFVAANSSTRAAAQRLAPHIHQGPQHCTAAPAGVLFSPRSKGHMQQPEPENPVPAEQLGALTLRSAPLQSQQQQELCASTGRCLDRQNPAAPDAVAPGRLLQAPPMMTCVP